MFLSNFLLFHQFSHGSQSLMLCLIQWNKYQQQVEISRMMSESTNDYLETLWKNADSQEMQAEPASKRGNVHIEHCCKLIKKEMVLRTSTFTLYRLIQRFRQTASSPKQNELPIVNFKNGLIKKYQPITRDPHEKIISQEPRQRNILPKKVTEDMLFFKYRDQFYLILKYMDQTLYDKIRYGVRQWREIKQLKEVRNLKAEYIHQFLTQITQALLALHKEKIFLGGLRPTTIGVLDRFQGENKKCYKYYIIDWSVANIVKPRQCLKEYDMAYLAPQFESGLNEQSDVWSLGCILYEMMSFGQKLISDLNFHSLSSQQKDQFIKDRLNELTYRIEYSNLTAKYKCAHLSPEVVSFLSELLRINPWQRISSKKLLQLLKNDKIFYLQSNPSSKLHPGLTNFYESKIIYDISMQIFRLSSIQDSIMTIFEELYFNKEKTVSKFHLYPLLKFASSYYTEAYFKLKDKSRCLAKNEKYDKHSQVKRIQDERKLMDIRDKAGAKMIKEMEQQKQFEKKKEVLRLFPEIKDEKIFYARDLYSAYLNYVKDGVCRLENELFYKPLLSIHFYMLELPEMQRYLENYVKQQIQLKFSDDLLRKHKDPEIIYFYRVNQVTNAFEKHIQTIFNNQQKNRQKQKIERGMKEYLTNVLTTR